MASSDALHYCKFVEKDSNVIDASRRRINNEEHVFTINNLFWNAQQE